LAGWLLWKRIGVKQGASEVENYGRGPWQEGLRNSTLYITLVALQCKYILALRRPNKGRKYNSNTLKDKNNRTKRLVLLGGYFSR